MDASGTIPHFAVRSAELRSLAQRSGPIASVYLATPGDVANAGALAEQRWRGLRRDLEQRGAPDEVLAHVDAVIGDAHTQGACLAAFATADGVVHVEHGEEELASDLVSWDALAVLGPLVKWRQSAPPYVLVVTDRRGADITAVGRGEEPTERTVEGGEYHIRKVHPGGWSQRRFQQRAENAWESHAREVAVAVQEACDAVQAETVVVAGDVRATQLLQEYLPDRIVEQVDEIPGGRSLDGSEEQVEDATRVAVATRAARATVELLEKFREERGQQDRAADGVDATLQALNASQVAVLLVHDDPDDGRRAWFGDDGVPVAAAEAAARDLGVDTPQSGRLVDAAIRAAFATGAGVWIVPRANGPADGMGALLRWA